MLRGGVEENILELLDIVEAMQCDITALQDRIISLEYQLDQHKRCDHGY